MTSHDKLEIFTREYLAYRSVLASAVRKVLRSRSDEVGDVLQDVWIRCAHALARHDVTHYRQWMYVTAVRAAITHVRSLGRKHPASNLEREDPVREPVDPAPAPDVLADYRRLHAAIGALERRIPKQVAVLRLVHLEECTHAEAASALGIAEGTSKSNAFKAVRQLRELMTALPEAA